MALLQDQGSKRDVYGRIGYANTYLYTAPKDRREDSVKKAEARFSKVRGEARRPMPTTEGAFLSTRGLRVAGTKPRP